MASYSTVKYGSRGSSVTALQNALNAAGYNLAADGVFGEKTLSAVKSYQRAQGLDVDGIVGTNTWGVLNAASAPSTPAAAAAPASASSDAQTMQTLLAQLKSPDYTPKTSDEIRQQAEGEYQSYYDQLRLAAQQQKDTADLALQQQREGLQTSYDKQREQSEKAYDNAYSTAGREQLKRGMARSSYGAQTLSNINTQGAEAQQAISEQQTAAEGNIDAQRTQLASQLAQQISQYGAGQAADVLNRMRELEEQEYDRSTAAQQYSNTLSQQIYQMLYQQQRDTVADQQWQAEFEENTRQFDASLAKSGSGNRKDTTDPKPDTGANPPGTPMTLAELTAMLSGGNTDRKQTTNKIGSAITSIKGQSGTSASGLFRKSTPTAK